MVKKLERWKNSWSWGEQACFSGRVSPTGAKWLPRSLDRSAQNESSELDFERAITLLYGNSAAARQVARGIEQTGARGGCACREETRGRCPSPDDCAHHDNVRRIGSVRAAGSARRRELSSISTPPSPT